LININMIKLDTVAKELFSKIRGRFPSVTIGDGEGNVVNEPEQARFFEFPFREGNEELGKISISLSEDDGVVVMHHKSVAENSVSKSKWFNFLKELRAFAKKRMLNFNTRDITKSNLEKRDYKYLANNTGDGAMNESKLYGTSRVSYQNIDNARLVIKHTESINQELATGRTQKIGKIYIESADGERFMYPYKHLSGARAMARHVAEGGKPFDDFGKHITGLSEELSKLRKFKTYMGRSAVMAESLSEYMDVVKERIATVKKTVESLQKQHSYKEAFESFETPVFEDVPDDVRENWIDQLTIKQFNEELADVFPYIYKLVSEATLAAELGPDDLMAEADKDPCWKGYKQIGMKKKGGKEVPNCVPEEEELERGIEEMMGQFSEASNDCDETCPKSCPDCGGTGDPEKYKAEKDLDEAYVKTSKDAIDTLGALRKIGKSIETGDGEYEGNLANMYVNDVYDVISWVENNLDINDPKYKQVIDPVVALRKKAKGMERETGSGKDARFGNEIVNTLYPLMQWIEAAAMDAKEGDDTIDVKMTPDGGIEKADAKDEKTPLGEFILSYYDRETGEFPKGETAVLTMVEKDYGEQFIEPAKAFIEQVNALYDNYQMETQPQQMEVDTEYDRMRELAGLR
jgi:hypothetical protein